MCGWWGGDDGHVRGGRTVDGMLERDGELG